MIAPLILESRRLYVRKSDHDKLGRVVPWVVASPIARRVSCCFKGELDSNNGLMAYSRTARGQVFKSIAGTLNLDSLKKVAATKPLFITVEETREPTGLPSNAPNAPTPRPAVKAEHKDETQFVV